MRIVLRTALVLMVFAVVGVWADHTAREHAKPGTPVAEVRLSAWMAGLFGGGAAASIALMLSFVKRR
ncbi:hypothetical protein ACFQBQ_07115 [Granulicella cerasi]|uniref:Uncharacterized protein n=1 Tax=Granulicella cerasi TaxID=741063 RepID=A0ABW1Z7D1_9BACT|nr:hypothetical protein [Granulicella cerasi]